MIDLVDIYLWLASNKWWLIALIPLALAVFFMKITR